MDERSVTLHDLIRRRGQTYRLMGRYDEALTDFNRALELQPEADWAVAERGETYRPDGPS
ncbi:MAG: tetratricopeptide repeat protein [Pseudonocardiaceae bacterium]